MEAQSVDLLDTIALLRRQLSLIVLTVVAALIVAGLFVALVRPLYAATALVRLENSAPDLLAEGTPANREKTDVDSLVELAKSRLAARRVADLLKLTADPDFASRSADSIADRLYEATAVERRDDAATLALTATSRRPDLSASLANGLAEVLIAMERQQRVATILSARDVARSQLVSANATVAQAELALDRFVAATVAAEAQATGRPDRIDEQLRLATTATGQEAITARAALPAPTRAGLDGLLQAARSAREQYQGLVATDARLTAEAELQVPGVVMVSPASAPSSPAWPNGRLVLFLAGLAGLTLGVCLAFLRESLFGGFANPDQLQAALDSPVGTVLPLLPAISGPLELDPSPEFGEAIRRLPVAIDLAVGRQRQASSLPVSPAGSVVLITSSTGGEGKSTLALSLARTLAAADQPPLLVDANLRAPGQQRLLGLVPPVGLLDYLQAEARDGPVLDIRSILLADPLSQTRIVIGTGPSALPTDHLVASAPLQRLIAVARTKFETTILDAPAIESAIDAIHLLRYADLIVFVVDPATPRRDVRRAFARLIEAKPSGASVLLALNQRSGPWEWPALKAGVRSTLARWRPQ